jgi:predicted amidophosphoribosyltransferase
MRDSLRLEPTEDIECPECERQIPMRADFCPHCELALH